MTKIVFSKRISEHCIPLLVKPFPVPRSSLLERDAIQKLQISSHSKSQKHFVRRTQPCIIFNSTRAQHPSRFQTKIHNLGTRTFETSAMTMQSRTGMPVNGEYTQQEVPTFSKSMKSQTDDKKDKPGSLAFADCEFEAVADLFYQFANKGEVQGDDSEGGIDEMGRSFLCINGVRDLLESIGERADETMLQNLFQHNHGKLYFEEFLLAADKVLGGKPAGIILVVGGPGSGKGLLCDRLAAECGSIHLSSGALLRDEVASGTPLGNECAEIMKRGGLVSSSVITALVRRRMRSYPKRRVLLDGFPRSLENAHDFIRLCGKPEVALHLDCDDTILMERIIKRAKQSSISNDGNVRIDDNIETALKRLRTFHKFHQPTIDWLREEGVPIVNLDCSGTPQNVWNQLVAIGRLMRPVVAYKDDVHKVKQKIFDFDEPSDISQL